MIEWIGNDPARARVALIAEQDRPESRQRSSVLETISAILDAG